MRGDSDSDGTQDLSLEAIHRLVSTGSDPTQHSNRWLASAIRREDLLTIKYLLQAQCPPNQLHRTAVEPAALRSASPRMRSSMDAVRSKQQFKQRTTGSPTCSTIR